MSNDSSLQPQRQPAPGQQPQSLPPAAGAASAPETATLPPVANQPEWVQQAETVAPEPGQPQAAGQRLAPAPGVAAAPTATASPRNKTATAASDSIQIPDYEILRELGRGGMGVVYLARHAKLNRLVALKMILAGAHAGSADQARFLSEAEAVAAFHHPNIVQVYEVGQHHQLPYMALEFVAGGSLAEALARGQWPAAGANKYQQIARLAEQLAQGMNAAHQAGFVHRDLKPANVLITEQRIPKITDFGLAKRVVGGSGLTQTGAIMGTPSYMAPEQAAGEGKRVGPAADVWALGAILYECLTGQPPFRAATPLDTLLKVVGEEPMPPTHMHPKIPKDLETICLKCLHKEPLKRYPSAAALAEDLRRWQADEPITARPVGQMERLLKWVKRRPAGAALISVSALALATLLVVGLLFNAQLQGEATRAEKEKTDAINARKDVEKVNNKLLQSQKALQKSNDQLLTSVARSLLRPLALQVQANQSVPPLADPEIEALWEIASSPESKLCLAFVEEALRGPVPTRQLKDRAAFALQAAVGLNPARRQQVEQKLLLRLQANDVTPEQRLHIALVLSRLGGQDSAVSTTVALALTQAMRNPENAFALRELAQGLSVVAARLEPKAAGQAAAALTQAMSNTTDMYALESLAQGLTAVSARLEPKAAGQAAATLTQAMSNTTNANALESLAQGLSAVSARLAPKAAASVCGQAAATLTQAMRNPTNANALGALAQGLSAVATRLEPKDAATCSGQAAAILTQAMRNTASPDARGNLAQGLTAVSARLEPKAAGQAAATLTQAMSNTTDMYALRGLAQALSAVAVRLEPKDAAAILAQAMRNPTNANALGALAQGLSAVAARLEPKEAAQAAATLTQAMTKTYDQNDLRYLAQALTAVSVRLEPKEAGQAAATLAQAMSNTAYPYMLGALAQSLSAVAARLEPKDAATVCGQAAATLTQAMRNPKNAFALGPLAQGLSAVAARLEPKAAATVCGQVAATLTQAVRNSKNAKSNLKNASTLWELAQGLSAVAPRLEPKEATTILTQAMHKTTSPDAWGSLAQGLSAVAARLEPKEAATVCGQAAATLTQAMSNTKDPFTLWNLAQGVSAVAAHLEPKEAATVCGQAAAILTQAMAKTTHPDTLHSQAQRLSAVLTDVSTAEQQQRTGAIMAVLAGPTDSFASLGRWALLPPALEPLPCRLSDQQLVDLLKHPFCVGEARRVILDHLGNRHHRRFDDQWAFVRYAQEQRLGLDFTTPPQRPGH